MSCSCFGAERANSTKASAKSEPTRRPAVMDVPGVVDGGFLDVGDGVKLHYVTSGERGARNGLMLFLHGFPEFHFSWREQMQEFSEDYYCVAVDMRGYYTSSKPEGVEAYDMELLVRDVRRAVEALGFQSCTLVAHDWGGVIAWIAAYRHPEVVRRLVNMNIPHPALFDPASPNFTWRQYLKSYYILMFQIPSFPEWLLARDNYVAVEGIFREPAIDKTKFSDEVLEAYRHAWSQPGALTAMINYYRAAWKKLRGPPSDEFKQVLTVPTLFIWGEEDQALSKELTYGTERFVRDLTLHYVPRCSHWVQQEQPETVNRLMRQWLASRP
eukprot:tig00001052_g6609.t1